MIFPHSLHVTVGALQFANMLMVRSKTNEITKAHQRLLPNTS
uniref:Uncharacterized protein n=1 Tax=Arundo donax TaxID=35708 RepID=A0A0A9CYN4_ARUDO